MDHLSSCYFCGVAVGEPLEDYQLPATSTTTTLCQSCQHKLDRVLEATGTGSTERVASSERPSGAKDHNQEEISVPSSGEVKDESEGEEMPEEDAVIDLETPSGDEDEAETEDDAEEATEGEEIEDAGEDEIEDGAETRDEEVETEDELETEGTGENEGEKESESESPSGLGTREGDESPSSGTVIGDTETPDDGNTEKDETVGEGEPVDDGPGIEEDLRTEISPGEESLIDESPEDVDPSILQADEIATGEKDLEEVISEGESSGTVTESPDEETGDSSDDAPTAEPEPDVSETDATDVETGTANSSEESSLEAELEEESGAESTDRRTGSSPEEDSTDRNLDDLLGSDEGTDETDADDSGGFEFDQEDEPNDVLGEKLRDEMEPEVPDEFDSIATGEADPEIQETETASVEKQDRDDASGDAGRSEDSTDRSEEDVTARDTTLSGEEEPTEASIDTEETDPTDSETEEMNQAGADTGATEEASDDTAETAQTGDGTEEKSTDGEKSSDTSISALEYNKVMRLLQNREFPVDRSEIETVASSAYELSEAECAEVIDIAVDRGLLAQEGGQLVKPE